METRIKKSMTPGLFLLDDRPEPGIDTHHRNQYIDGSIGVLSRMECLLWNMKIDLWLQSHGAVKIRMADQIHLDCKSSIRCRAVLTS